jgi:hypothetical protein
MVVQHGVIRYVFPPKHPRAIVRLGCIHVISSFEEVPSVCPSKIYSHPPCCTETRPNSLLPVCRM